MRFIFLLLSLPLYGVYVGNPADPALMNMGFFSTTYPVFKFTSGYIGDYTSNKRYQSDEDLTIKKFGLHSQLATFSLIFMERFQIFGTAGGTKEHAKVKEDVSFDDLSEVFLDFQSAHHFSWSSGAKIILFQWGQTFLSGDFTYFAIPASHKSFFKFLNRLNLPLEEKQKFNLREWQASVGLSSRFFFITPYAGASYLHSRLHIHDGPRYHNERSLGYFYGVTVSLTGRFHLNFERRVRDEFAYGFSTIAVF